MSEETQGDFVLEEKDSFRQLMEEGYKVMSEENLKEAREALNLTSIVILRDS
jgi:hypothetical protein